METNPPLQREPAAVAYQPLVLKVECVVGKEQGHSSVQHCFCLHHPGTQLCAIVAEYNGTVFVRRHTECSTSDSVEPAQATRLIETFCCGMGFLFRSDEGGVSLPQEDDLSLVFGFLSLFHDHIHVVISRVGNASHFHRYDGCGNLSAPVVAIVVGELNFRFGWMKFKFCNQFFGGHGLPFVLPGDVLRGVLFGRDDFIGVHPGSYIAFPCQRSVLSRRDACFEIDAVFASSPVLHSLKGNADGKLNLHVECRREFVRVFVFNLNHGFLRVTEAVCAQDRMF
jgi:hypothetical protein